MSAEKIIAIFGAFIIIVTLLTFMIKKVPKRLKFSQYVKKWRDIQKLCANREDWSHAIVHADMLVGEVLKKRKFVGKTMGEKLVNAQGKFSTNDSLWNAHKLANKIRQDGALSLKETDVKDALIAFRQALKDLGAL